MGKEAETTVEQRRAFGTALEAAMHSARIGGYAGLSKALAAVGVDRHEQTCGQWVKGLTEPRRAEVAALEVVCKVEPGQLSRHLGYVPVGVDTSMTIEQLVLVDPGFDDEDRAVLLGVLRAIRKP